MFCSPCRQYLGQWLERFAERQPQLWRLRRLMLALLLTYLFFSWLGSVSRPVVGAGFCRVFY